MHLDVEQVLETSHVLEFIILFQAGTPQNE
jgi:hypothetical protein